MQLANSAPEALTTSTSAITANELTFELRFDPNPKMLDNRGTWAEILARDLGLPEWRIVENRVDLFTTDKTRQAVVSFRNAGLQALDVPTREYFPDQVGKLMRKLFGFTAFGDRVQVIRIGSRCRFASPFNGTFDELAVRFATRYLSITEGARRAVGSDATLVDIGAPLNFKDRTGEFNTMSGPMKQEEFSRFFTKNEPFPEVGLFYDIDYYKKPNTMLGAREIDNLSFAFAGAAWDRHERVRDLILG
jgi:hypothetical protein